MDVFRNLRPMKMNLVLGLALCVCTIGLTNAQNKVTFTLLEESDRWTFIGNVSSAPGFMDTIPVEDRDSLLFSFLQQTNIKSMLSIHDETGSLYTTIVIDRESLPECTSIPEKCVLTFDIAARSNRVDSSLFEIISVDVIIEDKNDNFPTFQKETQVIPISETALNGSTHLIESANDEDTGANHSIQSYELVGYKDTFTIDVERKLDGSLSVKLVVIGKLDREKQDFYECTIYAKDGGNPVKTGSMKLNITILDENDNPPVLSQLSYNVTVKENIEAGTGILQVKATDKDIGNNGQILYRLSTRQSDINEIESLFQINEYTGVLSIRGQLQYEPGKVYKIIVEATDRGIPAMLSENQSVVNVYIEDTGNNPPVVTINLLSSGSGRVVNVSEYSNIGTFVAHVEVEDKDTGSNGYFTCSVGGDLFKLDPLPNKGFKLVVNGILDRESQDIHTVVVTCEDRGNPSLSSSSSFLVRVTDENDNPPVFYTKNYIEDLYENNEINDVVITVSARDIDLGQNGDVSYFLDASVYNYFKIVPSSGIIMAKHRFDRENRTSWTFKVYAQDRGVIPNTGSTTVLIRIKDRNDNAPDFNNTEIHYSLEENLPSGNSVGKLRATDADEGMNGIFTYQKGPSTERDLPFFVFPDGVIKNTMELDREMRPQYEFMVEAVDKGTPKQTGSVKVIVKVGDVNDEMPTIRFPRPENKTVTIPHMVPSGTYITQIEAFDADDGINRKLSYVIEDGNSAKLFLLDLHTGVLSMAKRYEVNENEEESHKLIISVHDGGIPQHSNRCELEVRIVYSNATMGGAQGDGSESTNNVVIVVVVILLTVCLSIAILVVICVLRKYDRDRMKNQSIQISKLPNNMNETKANHQNGTVQCRPYDNLDPKKKKEVSFSIEDDLDGFRDHEISFSNNSVFMDNNTQNENPVLHERQPSNQMKTFQLQQALLPSQSPPKSSNWNTVQKSHEAKVAGQGHPGDNHSDTSRETVTSDSGRGGSEDDLPLSHNSSKEEKDSHLPISNNKLSKKHVKSSVPGVHRPVGQHEHHVPSRDRPQSADITDQRIPNHNNKQFERSLSNLVGNEKPKFTVRKPYIEREVRDKKSQSEGWVPSYV